jgi:hypothetical protein
VESLDQQAAIPLWNYCLLIQRFHCGIADSTVESLDQQQQQLLQQ